MSTHIDHVPRWVRMAVAILALLNILYGLRCYFDTHVLFHAATGIDLDNPLIRNAGYEFAARNLAIGVALGFVTIIRGAPEALTILTLVRALIEVQTIILSLVRGDISAMLLVPVLLLAVEIYIVKTLVGVIKLEEELEK